MFLSNLHKWVGGGGVNGRLLQRMASWHKIPNNRGWFLFKKELQTKCWIEISRRGRQFGYFLWRRGRICYNMKNVSHPAMLLAFHKSKKLCLCLNIYFQTVVFIYRVTHKGWDFRDDCTEFVHYVLTENKNHLSIVKFNDFSVDI